MSKRHRQQQAIRGTYALCISIGLMIGLGFGPSLGSIPLSILGGGLLGAGLGYWFTHLKNTKKH